MLEFARYYGRKRVRGSVAMTAGVVVLTGLYVWMFPSIAASGVDLEQYVASLPPAVRNLFGLRALATIEGFLAAELYAFVWVLLLGLYLAYAAASVVAGDVEDGRMDLLLALPVSRTRLVVEKFAALLVPIAVVNAVTPIAVVVGTAAIGESVALPRLAMVHLLSVPYLLACAAIGLVASVVATRESVAQRGAMGAVFGLFLVESVVTGTDHAWLGALSPTRYFDQTAILVDGSYDLAGAGILLAATALLVGVAVAYFRRTDVE